jgi:hypothetical protein
MVFICIIIKRNKRVVMVMKHVVMEKYRKVEILIKYFIIFYEIKYN